MWVISLDVCNIYTYLLGNFSESDILSHFYISIICWGWGWCLRDNISMAWCSYDPPSEPVLYPPPHIPSRTKQNGRSPSKFQPHSEQKNLNSDSLPFLLIPSHSKSFQVESELNIFNKKTHLAILSHSEQIPSKFRVNFNSNKISFPCVYCCLYMFC